VQVAVDANPLMAALLGGRAAQILALAGIDFVTTEQTIWEVRKYFPRLADQLHVPEDVLLATLEAAPIRTLHPSQYDHARAAATRAIAARDPKGVNAPENWE